MLSCFQKQRLSEGLLKSAFCKFTAKLWYKLRCVYMCPNLKLSKVTNKVRTETPLLTHKMIWNVTHNFLSLRDTALAEWGNRSHEMTGCISWPTRSKFQFLLVRFTIVYNVIPLENDRGAKYSLQPGMFGFVRVPTNAELPVGQSGWVYIRDQTAFVAKKPWHRN